MASPFRAFRKHQKQWLAVIGILTILSFVFLPIALDRITAGRGPVIASVVTTTRYGSINEPYMQQLRQQRQVILGFLNQVAYLIREKGGFARDAMQMANEIGPNEEESVVTGWLLANRARELGIVVSDKSVKEFLQAVTRGFAYAQPPKDAKDAKPQVREVRVDTSQVRKILANLHVGQAQFLEICRTELMAQRFVREFSFSLEGLTPGQRWDYFQRIHRKATVEVLPVAVEKFVDQVPDPDDAAVRAFFEEHKNRLQVPDSPQPGFRQPHRIAVEYLKADHAKFVDPASVTEDQIKQYYEQFKDVYYREEPEKPEEKPVAGKPAAEKPAAEKPAAGKPAAEKPAAEKPAADKPAAKKPAAEKPAASPPKEGKPEKKPAETAPSTPAPAQKVEKKEQGKADADAKKSSRATVPTLYRFASFQAKGEAKPAAEVKKPAAEADKPSTEADKPAAAAKTPEGKPKESGEKAEAAPPPKYTPLEKVKDQIRDTLAQREATAKMQKVLSSAQEVLEAYHERWLNWKVSEATATDAKRSPPPARPDLKELAKQNALTYQEVPLVSAWEIKPFEIGSSNVASGSSNVGGGTPFVAYAFDTAAEFQPNTSQDTLGNGYLFWKTQDVPERVPSLDEPEIAERVVTTWKRVQARALARDEANRLAEEARKAQKSLTRQFGTRPGFVVTKTAPFTWMTFGSIPARFATEQSRPQISEVQGVEGPGTAFMKAVFDLSPGDVAVAPNQPETAYYAIRAVDFTPPMDELWTSFRDGADMQSIYRIAAGDQQVAIRTWFDALKDSVGLKWEREPYRARQE